MPVIRKLEHVAQVVQAGHPRPQIETFLQNYVYDLASDSIGSHSYHLEHYPFILLLWAA